jgi:excisionase family DNA binding protein
MVSDECKYLLAADLLTKLRGPHLWADAEISEEVQNVVRFCTRVQAFQNLPIHFLDSLERAVAVSDDVLVPQMKVGGEPNVEHSSFLQQGTGNKYSMPRGEMSKANRIDATGPIASSGDERPWTVQQAAQFLGVSPQTVYLWVDRKQIPHLRVVGRNIRFLRSDLEIFRASFRQEVEKV